MASDERDTLIERIEADPAKAIRVDRDGQPAWVRVRDGEFEVYATTEGFIQDRILTTTRADVRSKLGQYDAEIVPESEARF